MPGHKKNFSFINIVNNSLKTKSEVKCLYNHANMKLVTINYEKIRKEKQRKENPPILRVMTFFFS